MSVSIPEDEVKKWDIPSQGQRGDMPLSARWKAQSLTQTLTPTVWEARPSVPREKMLIDILDEVYRKMGIKGEQKVYIYYNDKPKHFYGTSLKGSLLFSTNSLDMYADTPEEIKSIIGHELTHYKNHELGPTALILASADMALSAILASTITKKIFKQPNKTIGLASTAAIFSGTFFPAFFAWRRRNEYKADLGSLEVASPQARIDGMEKLGERRDELQLEYGKPQTKHLSSYVPKPIARIFASHPPIEDRIKAMSEQKTQGFVEKQNNESKENQSGSALR